MGFTEKIKRLLFGEPFQDVSNVPPPVVDGRAAALRVLKAYLSEITFYRSGGVGGDGVPLPAISFQVPDRDIHDEWPDDEPDMHLPAIALLAQAAADYDTTGLNTNVEESSANVYAPGTVLSIVGEYTENFVIEVWSKTRAERRAMKVGIENALSPNQQMAGLRFILPEYYDRLATLVLQSCEYVDDDMSGIGRRKLRFVIQLSYLQVRLVKLPVMNALTEVDTLAPDEEDDPDPAESVSPP